MTLLPKFAISVRQPWAWAIIHGGKDVENRTLWAPWQPLVGQRVAIHASKGMTREEYLDAAAFCDERGIQAPAPADLVRGAIIGSVKVTGLSGALESPWFFGPVGLALSQPVACSAVPCAGALGVFDWLKRSSGEAETPRPWMLKPQPRVTSLRWLVRTLGPVNVAPMMRYGLDVGHLIDWVDRKRELSGHMVEEVHAACERLHSSTPGEVRR